MIYQGLSYATQIISEESNAKSQDKKGEDQQTLWVHRYIITLKNINVVIKRLHISIIQQFSRGT